MAEPVAVSAIRQLENVVASPPVSVHCVNEAIEAGGLRGDEARNLHWDQIDDARRQRPHLTTGLTCHRPLTDLAAFDDRGDSNERPVSVTARAAQTRQQFATHDAYPRPTATVSRLAITTEPRWPHLSP
jgi:hypothetical protein